MKSVYLRLPAGLCAAFLLTGIAPAQSAGGAGSAAGAAAAPQAAPVVVPQAVQPAAPISTVPDWSGSGPRTAQRGDRNSQTGRENSRNSTSSDGRADDATRQVPVPEPTAFQRLVAESTGSLLPIFGASLFENAPSTFAPVSDIPVPADYVVGPNDELRLSTSGQLTQQGSFIVDRSGAISIPGVGTIHVAGLRNDQLQPYLRQQLGRVYRNFELTVTLGQLRSIQVYVFGQASRPGLYTVSSLSTMLDAVFASGGPLPQGSLRHIELRRGGRLVTDLDLYDLLLRGDKSKDTTLLPGDVIFIPAAGPEVALSGAVNSPAIYELRGETTIAQLLQLSGGFVNTAAGDTVRVESIFEHRERSLTLVDLRTHGDTPLHDGDIVSVSPVSERFHDAVTLRGNVANPGRYVWHEGMKLSELFPTRDALITRDYWRQRGLLGLPVPIFQPLEGRVPVSTAPNGQATSAPAVQAAQAAQTTQAGTAFGQTPSTPINRPETLSSQSNQSSPNAGGTTIGEALTEQSGTFRPVNDIVLSAPDIDLAYAVIERQNHTDLTTSLIPFNLGKLVNDHDASQDLTLEANDVITIFSKADIRVPSAQQTRFVRLEGEFASAGVYSVLPGETLRSLVRRAGGLTPDAYLFASEFTRQSTKRIEQQRLAEYADSLDAQISAQVTTAAGRALDANDQAATEQSANTARRAVARLRTAQPSGRIVLKLDPNATGVEALPDLPLEDGDRLIVPRQPTSVSVAGQVYSAGAFLYQPALQVRYYLRDAGGPDRYADRGRVFVIRADGSVVSSQYSKVEKAPILPGDTVVVPPRLSSHNLVRDIVAITNIVGQLSITGAVIGLLH